MHTKLGLFFSDASLSGLHTSRGCLQRVSFRPFHCSWADSSRTLAICSIPLCLVLQARLRKMLASREVLPCRAPPGHPKQFSNEPCKPVGQSPTSASHCGSGHKITPFPKLLFFHPSGLNMVFVQPSPHPGPNWLIVAVDLHAVSPPRMGEQLSFPGSERMNSSFIFSPCPSAQK